MFEAKDHTFAICAYKESLYLEECVESLISQTIQTNIIITTSTPNEYIKGIAVKYSIPLIANENDPSIASDWNFAVSQTSTPLVTITHQDDVYKPDYIEEIIKKINMSPSSLIAFTDYGEIKNGI